MTYKDILVLADDGRACPSRLETAANLAAVHGAHLIGVYVRPELSSSGMALVADLDGELTRLHAARTAVAAQAAKAAFEQTAARAGVSFEWREVSGERVDVVAVHARYADLAVVGQSDPRDSSVAGDRRLAEHTALASGTPVLVIPYAGHHPNPGSHVLVAWNASREAKRAVSDALPVLVRAKRVGVLAINPREGATEHGDIPGADIALHLARHGVKAVCESIRIEDMEIGSMLLSRAADEEADLLVMGAYGHSRLRELVLGGVTRHILAHMTIPVLLSH